jgi:UPF0755 protein
MKKIYYKITAGILGLIFIAIYIYNLAAKAPALKSDQILFISSEMEFQDVFDSLSNELTHPQVFKNIAEMKSYPKLIKTGRYELNHELSNIEIINQLRLGIQKPIRLTFNNQNSIEELSGRIAQQIALDSSDIYKALSDAEFLEEQGFDQNTALLIYMPNTYEVYWNIDAKDLRLKFLKSYRRFWTEERISKAKEQGLSPKQVGILASIVQKETSFTPERPKVAGLYLNRIHAGWPLQSDPTVIYAVEKQENIKVKRVLNKDLRIDSPYNTYKFKGLPPGPIAMPDINAIESVLNPEKHSYYYMCASVTNLGQHVFSRSLKQHNINARAYQNWVNKQGIMR